MSVSLHDEPRDELDEEREAWVRSVMRAIPLGLRMDLYLWAHASARQWRGRKRHGVRRRQRR